MKLKVKSIPDDEKYEEPVKSSTANDAILIRHPRPADAQNIWHLVRDAGVLDLNSVYCYLLLCEHFSGTCRVAEKDGKLVGFVTAYVLPDDKHTLFIWQIGTAVKARGRGIAGKLILELLSGTECRNINMLQATITPANSASLALFRSMARRLNTGIEAREYFSRTLFPDRRHEQENLLTVGPFSPGGPAP